MRDAEDQRLVDDLLDPHPHVRPVPLKVSGGPQLVFARPRAHARRALRGAEVGRPERRLHQAPHPRAIRRDVGVARERHALAVEVQLRLVVRACAQALPAREQREKAF